MTAPAAPCPGCGHAAAEHEAGLGCTNGWAYDVQGIAIVDGCDCPWTLA